MLTTRSAPSGQPAGDSASAPESTVYIVDDDAGMRKSLRWLVETLGVAVKIFPSAASFLDAYDDSMPGCLVLDVRMPEMSGLELQEELKARGIEIPVIVLTGYADVPSVVRAFKGGAFDFLEKPFSDEILLQRIQRALSLDRKRRRKRVAVGAVREGLARLTRRERETLDLVVEGLSSKQVASRLRVSFKTVEAHRASIMKKLGAEGVAHLVRMVVSARQSEEEGEP
jgi:two-component system, LuxR family, response regulator FixJ